MSNVIRRLVGYVLTISREPEPRLTQVRSVADGLRVMRRNGAALIALLCASAMLGAGCGSGVSRSHAQGAGARTLALANAINLRPGDVPGLAGRFERDREARSGPLGNCDEASARGLAGFLSQRFTRGGASVLPTESVSSGVYVMASETQADRELVALGSSQARGCIRHDVERTIANDKRDGAEPFLEAPVEVLALAPLLRPLPVAGMRRITHLAAASRFSDGRSKIYLDQCVFVVGRVLVDLLAVGSPHPFSLVTERRLLTLLDGRAHAHRLS